MKKILLDENLPERLSSLFPKEEYQIHSIDDLKGKGKDDYEMLTTMEVQNYNGLLTADRNPRYQQNLKNISFCIYVIITYDNRYDTLAYNFQKNLSLMNSAVPFDKVIEIDIR